MFEYNTIVKVNTSPATNVVNTVLPKSVTSPVLVNKRGAFTPAAKSSKPINTSAPPTVFTLKLNEKLE